MKRKIIILPILILLIILLSSNTNPSSLFGPDNLQTENRISFDDFNKSVSGKKIVLQAIEVEKVENTRDNYFCIKSDHDFKLD